MKTYFTAILLSAFALHLKAADWPTYLHSYDRAGVTAEQLQFPLQTNWVRSSTSALRRAWSAAEGKTVEGRDLYDRVRFDDALQVAVVGNRVFFGSSVDHKLYCLNARSGKEQWSFFAGAAIRLAPTVVEDRVYVGSDDGYVYCVAAETGKLVWKFRPGPSDEWFLGRGEMISRWPVRTGILVENGVAYFGAGIFPHENVYVCAVDASTGEVIWRNDHISHQEAGREDLSPQGYLLASPYHIYVPSGRTRPKSFDRETGRFLGSGMTKLEINTATLAGTSAIMLDGRLHHYSPGSHIAGTAEAGYVTNGAYLARVELESFSKISSTARQLKNEQRELFPRFVTHEKDKEMKNVQEEPFVTGRRVHHWTAERRGFVR